MADQRVDGARAASSPALRTIAPRRLPMARQRADAQFGSRRGGGMRSTGPPPWRSRSGSENVELKETFGRRSTPSSSIALEVEFAVGLLEPLRHSARPWRTPVQGD